MLLLLLVVALGDLACGRSYSSVYPPTPSPQAYEAYLRARILREQGQLEPALAQIAIAIAADPDALRPRVEQADLLRLAGRHDEALERLDALVDDFPDEPEPRYVRARVLHDRSDTPRATTELDALLLQHPAHTDAAFLRAELAIDAGQLERARDVLDTLLEHRPEVRRAWLALGNVAFQAGDHATAVRAFDAWLERDTRTELAWLRLAESHRALGQPRRREAVLADCVEHLPQSRDCKVAFLTAVAERPQTDDLVERIDTLVLSVPHDDAALDDQTLARLAMRILESLPLEASSPFIERVIERRPGLVDLAYFLGVARSKAGDPAGALWALREIPADSARWPDAAFHIGLAQLGLGREDDAATTAEQLLEANPERVEGYLLLADARAATDRFDDALATLEAAREALPRRRVQIDLAAGRILEEAGRPDHAEALYRALLDGSAPASGDELLHLDTPGGGPGRQLARARFALARLRLAHSSATTPPADLDEIATLVADALAALPELREPWLQALEHTDDPALRRALEQRLGAANTAP